jgi:hypothetical protein
MTIGIPVKPFAQFPSMNVMCPVIRSLVPFLARTVANVVLRNRRGWWEEASLVIVPVKGSWQVTIDGHFVARAGVPRKLQISQCYSVLRVHQREEAQKVQDRQVMVDCALAREVESAYYSAGLAYLRLYTDAEVAERYRRDPAGQRNRGLARTRTRQSLDIAEQLWRDRMQVDKPELVEDDRKRAIDAMMTYARAALALLVTYRGGHTGPMETSIVLRLETAGVVPPLETLAMRGSAGERQLAARMLRDMNLN